MGAGQKYDGTCPACGHSTGPEGLRAEMAFVLGFVAGRGERGATREELTAAWAEHGPKVQHTVERARRMGRG